MPYQVVSLAVQNFVVSADSYDATVDGSTPVRLAKVSDSTLAFVAPVLSAGPHTLTATLGQAPVSVVFTESPAVAPPSLDVLLANQVAGIQTAIDQALADPANAASAAWLQTLKQQADELPALGASLSQAEQEVAAGFIQANYVANRSSAASALVARYATSRSALSSACLNSLNAWRLSGQVIAVDIATVVAGYLLAAPTGGLSALLSGYGLISFFVDVKDVRTTTKLVIATCVTAVVEELGDQYVADVFPPGAALTAAELPIAFLDQKQKVFRISTGYALPDDLLQEMTALRARIASVPAALMPDDAATFFGSIARLETLPSRGDTYSLSSVSDPLVAGTVAPESDGSLALTFTYSGTTTRYTDPAAAGGLEHPSRPFTFTLVDSRDGHDLEVSATITKDPCDLAGTWIWTRPTESGACAPPPLTDTCVISPEVATSGGTLDCLSSSITLDVPSSSECTFHRLGSVCGMTDPPWYVYPDGTLSTLITYALAGCTCPDFVVLYPSFVRQ
jgi:hypothetical protein